MLSSVLSVCFSGGAQRLYDVLVRFAVIHGAAWSRLDLCSFCYQFWSFFTQVFPPNSLFYGGNSELFQHQTLPKGVSVLKAGMGERNARSGSGLGYRTVYSQHVLEIFGVRKLCIWCHVVRLLPVLPFEGWASHMGTCKTGSGILI